MFTHPSRAAIGRSALRVLASGVVACLVAAMTAAAPGPGGPPGIGHGAIKEAANPKFVPVGSVIMFAGATAPTGYLLCDGSEVSRSEHSNLFNAIGSTYGAGDGSTTFNVPDLRQRFPLGLADAGTGSVLGEAGGQIDHDHDVTGTISAVGDHAHGVTGTTASAGDHGHAVNGSAATAGSHGHSVSGSTNPAGTHNHVVLIRAQGVDGGLLAGDGQRVLNANIGGTTMNSIIPGPLNAQDGILGVKGATGQQFGSSAVPDHAHSFSATASASGDHGHSVTGTAANAGAHPHSFSTTSANAGAHAHALDATASATNPPYVVLNFIIKE